MIDRPRTPSEARVGADRLSVEAVAQAAAEFHFPLVVDPVMIST